jgi:hypothetical protein
MALPFCFRFPIGEVNGNVLEGLSKIAEFTYYSSTRHNPESQRFQIHKKGELLVRRLLMIEYRVGLQFCYEQGTN